MSDGKGKTPAERPIAVSLADLQDRDPDLAAVLPLLLQAQAEYDQLRTAIAEMQVEQARVYKDFVALADSLPHKKVEGLYTRIQPKPSETLSRAKLLEYVPIEVLEECTKRKPVKGYYKIAPVGGSGEER